MRLRRRTTFENLTSDGANLFPPVEASLRRFSNRSAVLEKQNDGIASVECSVIEALKT